MPIDLTATIQYAFMFCTGIFFSAIAIDRKTIVTTLLAAVIWLIVGIINWLFAPTSYIGQGMSYLFWVISMVFFGAFLYIMATMHFDNKHSRFEMGPL